MACEALGRCRICARKHKIAVFGGGKSQHFFIEKANLKLIILNTVCILCIGKIESFVKKMELDMVFKDYIKHEDQKLGVKEETGEDDFTSIEKKITEDNMSESMLPSVEDHVENPTANSNGCNEFLTGDANATANDTQPRYPGDSQSPIIFPRSSNYTDQIGQGGDETSDATRRKKRPRILRKIQLTKRSRIEPNVEKTDTMTSGLQMVSENLETGDDCSSGLKKGGRLLSCDFCKKEFTHAGDYNKHRRKHTGEKPYECEQCKRKFAHASNLARHQRVHSGERPFACNKCKRTFTRKDKMVIHTNAGRCQIDDKNNDRPNIAKLKPTHT